MQCWVRSQSRQSRSISGWSRVHTLLGLVGLVAISGWLWWTCRKNPETNFLPRRSPAEWIVYPNPPDAGMHRIAESKAEFRRDFVLQSATADGVLRVCGFREFGVKLN